MNARLLMFGAVAAASSACGAPFELPCSSALADACRKGGNLAALVGIAYADAVAGGSPFLGEAATRGPGRVAFQLRSNTVRTRMPKPDGVSFRTDGSSAGSGVQSEDMSTTALSAELTVGVLRGVPIGSNHAFGVDLLGGLSTTRDYSSGGMAATAAMNSSQRGNWNHGSSLGVRVGLAEESRLIPGVSFTYVTRSLPAIQVNSRGTGSAVDELFAIRSDVGVRDAAWRLVASKTIQRVGLSVGFGTDTYDVTSDTHVALTARPSVSGKNTTYAQLSRHNIYASAFTNIGVVKLVGEAGMLSGGQLSGMSDPLDRDSGASHGYFTLGLRIGK